MDYEIWVGRKSQHAIHARVYQWVVGYC